MSQPNTEGRYGQAGLGASASQFNALQFLIQQALAGRNTATLVRVVAVTNAGILEPVGFIDVLPLVNHLDGQKNAVLRAVVHDLPYFRLQGGANAVILDPQVGDIGLAVFADRDISAVKASRGPANPGSSRRADLADGLYLGGFLNAVPVQVVRFAADGIHVTSPTAVHIAAPAITSAGEWTHTGTLTASVDVVADGVSLKTHAHGGITPGGASTAGPD